jgi:ADP-ribosylglycohydrolase
MVKSTLLSRAQGALLGQLVGDALGSAVRGWSPDRIRAEFPDGVHSMTSSAERGTIPGQPGDHTELALALARSLVHEGEYHESAARSAYEQWLRASEVGADETVRSALEGTPSTENTSNGALMRVSPIGIFGSRVWSGVVEMWAREDAAITHPAPICLAASELYAVAIANAIRVPSPREVLFEHLRARAEQMDTVLADEIKKARTDSPDYITRPDNVIIPLHNALWQLLHANSFEDALIDTIDQGGDTGTNAAVCGALLGAVLGRDAIPEAWSGTVLNCRPNVGVLRPRPREYWPIDALELAEKLVADRPANLPV